MDLINREYIEKYIQSLIIEEDREMDAFRRECEENCIPIIHKEVAQLIRLLIRLTGSTRVLEIGTAVGFSSIFMSKTIDNENGYITTIDRNKKFIALAKENLIKYSHKTPITIKEGDATEILSGLTQEYDIIFMDAAKSKYMAFHEIALKLLRPGGLVISDNVLYQGMIANDDLVVRRQRTIVRKMRQYLEFLHTDPSLETSVLPIGDGLAISLKKY
ncbi:MAG: O-methyltransferase [Eubacteriales bacterium]|nr:O-methyltransferase [Eubacteriales bacterium]